MAAKLFNQYALVDHNDIEGVFHEPGSGLKTTESGFASDLAAFLAIAWFESADRQKTPASVQTASRVFTSSVREKFGCLIFY